MSCLDGVNFNAKFGVVALLSIVPLHDRFIHSFAVKATCDNKFSSPGEGRGRAGGEGGGNRRKLGIFF